EVHREFSKRYHGRLISTAQDALDVQTLLDSLKPMREQLARVQAQLVDVRLAKTEDPRLSLRGPVTVRTNPEPPAVAADRRSRTIRYLWTGGAGLAAFVVVIGVTALLRSLIP